MEEEVGESAQARKGSAAHRAAVSLKRRRRAPPARDDEAAAEAGERPPRHRPHGANRPAGIERIHVWDSRVLLSANFSRPVLG